MSTSLPRYLFVLLLASCVRFSPLGVNGACEGDASCGPGYGCQANHCAKLCRLTSECETGEECALGFCSVSITTVACAETCGVGDVCKNGACLCDRNTCAGCCTSDGHCSASSADACGRLGADCGACGATPVCNDGLCQAACATGQCASGCCTTASCEPGTSVEACGKDGSPCSACTGSANGNACINGACGCAEDEDCPPQKICESGACVPGCRSSDDCGPLQACVDKVCSNSGCGDSAPCNGGCCSGGTCFAGTASSACGAPGAQCNDCGTLGCVKNACECTPANQAVQCNDSNPCTPDTCEEGVCKHGALLGCVDGAVCIPFASQTNDRCQRVGFATCKACPIGTPVCDAQATTAVCKLCYNVDQGSGKGVDVCGSGGKQCFEDGKCVSSSVCGSCDGGSSNSAVEGGMCVNGCACPNGVCPGGVCNPSNHCGCLNSSQCSYGTVCHPTGQNCYFP